MSDSRANQRRIGHIKSHKEFKPGDIIFFPNAGYLVSNIIESGQKRIQSVAANKEDGQARNTHAAICIGYNESGAPMIAHMVSPKYQQISLTEYVASYGPGGDSALTVFRPKDEDIAQRIAEEAAAERNKKIQYSAKAAAKSALTANTIAVSSDDEKELEEIHCSGWVQDILNRAKKNEKELVSGSEGDEDQEEGQKQEAKKQDQDDDNYDDDDDDNYE
jgi:hypothetical protein